MASDIQQLMGNLSQEKRALLQRRLQEQRASRSALGSITRRQDAGPCDLSFAQELMWLLDHMVDTSAYHVPRAMRIQGPLDPEALSFALNEIVVRHEILRTTYRVFDGKPMQVVSPAQNVNIARINLSDVPVEEREIEAQRILIEEGGRRFDLANDPLLRAVLIELEQQHCILLLTTHHIASDGESRDVFFREIQACYSAFLEKKKPGLPELPIQYADFAAWQRKSLTGELLDGLLSYWKNQLNGAPKLFTLPTDRPRPAVQSFHGAAHTIAFPAGLLSELKKLSREEQATVFMTGLAAFSTFLFRYTGQQDIVIGTPVSGRSRTEVEPLIGYFSNSVVLRMDHSGNPTFRELVRQAREVALGAFSHQEMPFERLVVELQPERDSSYSPIYQVMFSVGEQWRRPLELPGVKVSMLPVDLGTAKFDLNLGMGMQQAQVWGGMLSYCTALYDHSSIVRAFGHFQNLLAGIVNNPDQRIQSLPMLSPDERQRVVVDWNATGIDFQSGKTVHALVEQQVERTPDATAITFGDDVLTYRELNERANQLAHHLHSCGLGPGDPVGVYLNRSLLLPVAYLGVLKAGGVCVPLDPGYPRERLVQMLDDLHGPVVLSQAEPGAKLAGANAKLLLLSTNWDEIAGQSRTAPVTRVGADDIAYIIFTSGSTGRPRGVTLTHAGLANHHLAAVQLYGLNASDRVMQFSSLSFDIALEEIFPTWIAGATLVMRRDDLSLVPTDFTRWIAENRISVLDLPTAYWHEWIRDAADDQSLPETLRLVILGGEKASSNTFALWKKLARGKVRLVNTYGPTEASIIATAYEPKSSPEDEPPSVLSIGRPIANARIYILDVDRNPLPVGVPGEIYIGGVGVASGYLEKPELTAEKFIVSPFDPADRLYRTGDLGRFLPDGNIEFLGRVDNQVKIRGFRVEPGEVESALAQHPAVQQLCVSVRQDETGEKKLVAYCVCSPGVEINGGELRNFLKTKLPDYMLPSHFVLLDRIPLTVNGKVDTSALPSPERPVSQKDEAAVTPETPLQTTVAAIWSEVLKISPIGIHDNFFELGGHSLLAVQVVSRIRKQLGPELSLRALFENPSVAELSAAITTSMQDAPEIKTTIVPRRRRVLTRPVQEI